LDRQRIASASPALICAQNRTRSGSRAAETSEDTRTGALGAAENLSRNLSS
jgi:hypothetical protein